MTASRDLHDLQRRAGNTASSLATMTLFVTPRETAAPQPHQGQGWVPRVRRGVLASVVSLVAAACWVPAVQAFSSTEPAQASKSAVLSRSGVVPLSRLPVQGQDVYQRILRGGPFRYAKDGTVFFNREAHLPRKPRGFYHEYTVPTPGSRDRGARRIVCGGEIVQSPETCFYTQDHYQSFQKIDPSR